jgi:hypothetical protein
MTRVVRFAVPVLVLLLFAGDLARAEIVYMRSAAGRPWNVTANEQAMDAAFGAGGWQDLRYETVDPLAIFSQNTSFAYLEGGDRNANQLEAFLNANLSTIEGWVANGGSLFVNAAPNQGDGMNFGFGVTLGPIYNVERGGVSAVDAAHPIFNGPFTPIALTYTGHYFAHTNVIGDFTPLLQDSRGVTYLAEKDFGNGHVMFGGMTTTNWHFPKVEAFNLRANILSYGAAQSDQADFEPAVVDNPEPSSLIAFMGMGAVGLVIAAVRRRRGRRRVA